MLLNEQYNNYSFLYNIQLFDENTLQKSVNDLYLKFKTDEDCDFDPIDLKNELLTLKPFLKKESTKTPLEILCYIFQNKLLSLFPNVAIVIRLFLTLPLTVASGERSFSKLKIIKNYLRSSMKQDRLSGLAIIAIEHSIAEKINYSDIISEFSYKKVRKVQFS